MYIVPLINLANKKVASWLLSYAFNLCSIHNQSVVSFGQSMSWASNHLSFYYLGQIAYRLFDHGVANILCLKTLYHGTCLPNYISIRLHGGLCSKGGSKNGATIGNISDNTSNAFYLLKDSKDYSYDSYYNCRVLKYFGYLSIPSSNLIILPIFLVGSIIDLTHIPSLYSSLSTANFMLSIMPTLLIGKISTMSEGDTIYNKPKRQLLIRLLALLCPTPFLNFKYDTISSTFKDDPVTPYGYKVYTDQSPLRIGLLGTVYSSYTANIGWYERVQEDPIKPLIGLAEIAALTCISKYLLNAVAGEKSAQIAVAAGFMLA